KTQRHVDDRDERGRFRQQQEVPGAQAPQLPPVHSLSMTRTRPRAPRSRSRSFRSRRHTAASTAYSVVIASHIALTVMGDCSSVHTRDPTPARLKYLPWPRCRMTVSSPKSVARRSDAATTVAESLRSGSPMVQIYCNPL